MQLSKLDAGRNGSDLWAITSYFNPIGYRRRLANFRIFRQQLRLPLVAVELAYGREFELEAGDADILIQMRGGAVLWQKERLLNVALKALPSECDKVAWLDCDIIFATNDWADAAISLLEKFPIIQLFRQVHNVGAQWVPGTAHPSQIEFTRPSAASSMASGVPAKTCLGHLIDNRKITSAPGFAWAARRDLLDRHNFFDACIVGGGQRAMACALTNCLEELMERHLMNEHERKCYITWAEPFYDSVRTEMAFVDVEIFHLWHGDVGRRRSLERLVDFQRFQFDPCTDIRIASNGCWQWSTDKHEMHEYVRDYFAFRMEDGASQQC